MKYQVIFYNGINDSLMDKCNRIVGYLVPVDEKMTEQRKKRLKKYSNKFIALKNSKENKT